MKNYVKFMLFLLACIFVGVLIGVGFWWICAHNDDIVLFMGFGAIIVMSIGYVWWRGVIGVE